MQKTGRHQDQLTPPPCPSRYRRLGQAVFDGLKLNLGNGFVTGPLPLDYSQLVALVQFYNWCLDDYQRDFLIDVQWRLLNHWVRD